MNDRLYEKNLGHFKLLSTARHGNDHDLLAWGHNAEIFGGKLLEYNS